MATPPLAARDAPGACLLEVDLAAVHLAQAIDGYDGQPVPTARIQQWIDRIQVWAHRYPNEVHRYRAWGRRRVLYDPHELLAAAAARRPRRVLDEDQTRM